MAIKLEQLPAHIEAQASPPGRNDPLFRINARCETLKETARQGQAGLRWLLELSETAEQTAQDLADGLSFLRIVEIDLEGFEAGGINFLPGLESCDHTKVMERVFGLTRDRPIIPKIRGGRIVAKPPEVVDYAKIMEEVLAARNLREGYVLLEHTRESLVISQWVIRTKSIGGNFSDLDRAYAVKFIKEKSQGYMDLADEALAEAKTKSS